MLIRKLFFILTIVLLPSGIYAQDFQSDIEKALRIFNEETLELEVEHLFYPSANATTPTERQTVWMRKMNDNYHLKQYGIEMIRNSQYTILINEQANVIGISDTKVKQPDDVSDESPETIQELLKSMESFLKTIGADTLQAKEEYTMHYLGVSGGTKKYRFDYHYGQCLQTTLSLSTKTGLLERISCILREPMEIEHGVFQQVKIDMVYRVQETGKKFTNATFSIDHIAKVSPQGEVVLTEKYNEYRLLNNLYNYKEITRAGN